MAVETALTITPDKQMPKGILRPPLIERYGFGPENPAKLGKGMPKYHWTAVTPWRGRKR